MEQVTIDPYALVSAAEFRDYFGESSSIPTDRRNLAINAVTQLFERYCGRNFISRKYWNHIVGDPTATIILPHTPILSIESIYDGFQLVRASGTADSGSVLTLVDNARTEDDDYWNGAELAVELSSGHWQRRNVDDFVASTDTLSVAARDAFAVAVATPMAYRLTQYVRLGSAYADYDIAEIDHAAGMVMLNGVGGDLIVNYIAGMYELPSDLKIAAFHVIEHLMQPGRDMSEVARQFAGKTKKVDGVVANALEVLGNYRRNTVLSY